MAKTRVTRAISWSAGAYLLLQLVVPLFVMARGELTSRDFAWDMFSYHLHCDQLNAIVRVEGGPWESWRLDHDFGSWAQLRRALSEPRFTAYAQRVCQRLREERGGAAELHLLSECRADRDRPPFALLNPERDFCSPR